MLATVRHGPLGPTDQALVHGAGGGRFEPRRGHAASALVRVRLESGCSQGRGACPLGIAVEQQLPAHDALRSNA